MRALDTKVRQHNTYRNGKGINLGVSYLCLNYSINEILSESLIYLHLFEREKVQVGVFELT